MELPPDLRLALERATQSVPLAKLQVQAQALSERYRSGHAQGQTNFLHSRDDVLAYATMRMPATWVALHAALQTIAEQAPDWQPATLLDVGAGPGTVAWAAAGVWPQLGQIICVEREGHMVKLGRDLAQQARAVAIRSAVWHTAALQQQALPQAELVTAAYLYGELPPAQQSALTAALWAATTGVLLLVEPGTPRGFALIRAAREQLLAAGAHMLAPCPHSAACPLAAGDWCHFAARVARSRLHRAAKGADLGYEDEKYAYVAVARFPTTPAPTRILRHPHVSAGKIELELCTPVGLQRATVTKRDTRWRAARKASWGDAFGPED